MSARGQAVFGALLLFVLTGGATQAANALVTRFHSRSASERGAGTVEVVFDHPGGFYESAFRLALAAPVEGATIYYTTNGASARPESAMLYAQPIAIATTTVVRAAAFSEGTNLMGTAARTYLFIPDILGQTGALWANTWGTNQGQPIPAHYAMTTASEKNAAARAAVAEGLKSIASLSIIADPSDLFSAETGIYAHPLERGAAWERPVSVEMIDAAGRPAFQCGGGLRIHGGMSRHPEESPKHSFRLVFRPRYGSSKLRFPLFGAERRAGVQDLVLARREQRFLVGQQWWATPPG